MTPTLKEPLHTYNDISAATGMSYKTIYRWFRRRKKFKPTNGTVRIPDSEFHAFIAQHTCKQP